MNNPTLFKSKEDITTENIRALKMVNPELLKGYELIKTYFVDSSGFGKEDERALTFNSFIKEIKIGFAYGIIEAGQFQVHIGEFKPIKNLTEFEYLKPVYDSRKSFYHKAVIIREENKIKLISYNTMVCFIENGKAKVLDYYSTTTLRHIKEFLKQNGFKAESSKQILNDYK